MKTRIARHVAIYLFIALTGYGIGACRQNVMLNPTEDDLIVLNGCVVSACNYLAAVKTQHTLEQNFWAKILLVRYVNHPAGHAYCVWETDGTIYGYDHKGKRPSFGSRRLSPCPLSSRGKESQGANPVRGLTGVRLPIGPLLLFKRLSPGTNFKHLKVGRVLLIIFLMILFRRPEFHRRQNLSYNRFIEPARGRQLRL